MNRTGNLPNTAMSYGSGANSVVFLVTIGVPFRRLLFSPKVFGYLEETRLSCGLLSFTDRVTGNNWNKLLTFSFGILHGILSDSNLRYLNFHLVS